METVDASQHQSSHQKSTPCDSYGWCSAKYDSAWATWLQSQTLQAPLKQRAVGERAARQGLRRGELRVVVGDAGVHVQRDVDALGLGPGEERLRVGEQGRVPFPAVPRVGGLPVGVDGQVVERDVVGAERGDQRVLVIGRGVRVVVGVPDAEVGLVEQRRRAGQLVEVLERLAVVVAVDEQVAVLDVPVRRPRLHPAVLGPYRAVRCRRGAGSRPGRGGRGASRAARRCTGWPSACPTGSCSRGRRWPCRIPGCSRPGSSWSGSVGARRPGGPTPTACRR